MLNAIDGAVTALRAIAIVTTIQAAGFAIFLSLFGSQIAQTDKLIRKLTFVMAAAAALLVVMQHAIEPARMTASMAGIFDQTLQMLLLESDAGAARTVRVLGLILIAVSACGQHALRSQMGLVGAVVALGSFTMTGHTANHPQRWILSPLLLLHLLVAAFWFGALTTLWLSSGREQLATTAVTVRRFSAIAGWLVPILLLAGIGLAAVLIPGLAAFSSPYGSIVIVKLLAFCGLIILAAVNRFRLGPAMVAGSTSAQLTFRRLVGAEWLIVVMVLILTSVMTGLFGPE